MITSSKLLEARRCFDTHDFKRGVSLYQEVKSSRSEARQLRRLHCAAGQPELGLRASHLRPATEDVFYNCSVTEALDILLAAKAESLFHPLEEDRYHCLAGIFMCRQQEFLPGPSLPISPRSEDSVQLALELTSSHFTIGDRDMAATLLRELEVHEDSLSPCAAARYHLLQGYRHGLKGLPDAGPWFKRAAAVTAGDAELTQAMELERGILAAKLGALAGDGAYGLAAIKPVLRIARRLQDDLARATLTLLEVRLRYESPEFPANVSARRNLRVASRMVETLDNDPVLAYLIRSDSCWESFCRGSAIELFAEEEQRPEISVLCGL